jgi:phage/plasmid-like protein (TIGR03299 family)
MPAEVDSMFYEGETPWHGLGVKVEKALTAAEAIKAAGLDWEIHEYPVLVNGVIPAPGYKALVRSDNQALLSIVTKSYQVVQNSAAFQFFDAVTTTGKAKYHTAGSLREGRQVWMLARLPGEVVVTRDDVVDKFVLFTTSHDYSSALIMQWTPVRVVCMNTLNAAIGEQVGVGGQLGSVGSRFYARHTVRIHSKVSQAQDILGIADVFYKEFMEAAQRMATLALPAPDISLLAANLFGLQPGIPVQEQHKFRREAYGKVMELVEVGRGQTAQVRGTRWGMFNAVAEYADYYQPNRAGTTEARLRSTWYGRGAELKAAAWRALTKNL